MLPYRLSFSVTSFPMTADGGGGGGGGVLSQESEEALAGQDNGSGQGVNLSYSTKSILFKPKIVKSGGVTVVREPLVSTNGTSASIHSTPSGEQLRNTLPRC